VDLLQLILSLQEELAVQ